MAASPALLGCCALCMRASFSGHIQSSSGFRTHTVSHGRKRPLPGTVPRPPARFLGAPPATGCSWSTCWMGPSVPGVGSGIRVLEGRWMLH